MLEPDSYLPTRGGSRPRHDGRALILAVVTAFALAIAVIALAYPADPGNPVLSHLLCPIAHLAQQELPTPTSTAQPSPIAITPLPAKAATTLPYPGRLAVMPASLLLPSTATISPYPDWPTATQLPPPPSSTATISPYPDWPTAMATRTSVPTSTATARFTATPTATPTRTAPTLPATRTPAATSTPTPVSLPGRCTLQDGLAGYQGTSATTLSSWEQTKNLSAGDMTVRSGGGKLGLLRFDLTGMPQGAILRSATLRLYTAGSSNPMGMHLQGYVLKRAWAPAEATWLGPVNGELWAAPGANGVPQDRAAYPIFDVNTAPAGQWTEADVTSIVRTWLADPRHNDGLAIRGEGANSVEYSFGSKNALDPTIRPQLVLVWEDPGRLGALDLLLIIVSGSTVRLILVGAAATLGVALGLALSQGNGHRRP